MSIDELLEATPIVDGQMVVARGADQDNMSLEKFSLYGRPQRIKVELIDRVQELNRHESAREHPDFVLSTINDALDAIASATSDTLGRTPSLRSDGEMRIGNLECRLIELLAAMGGCVREPSVMALEN